MTTHAHTPGAMRAQARILQHLKEHLNCDTVLNLAKIIDEETAAPELAEALARIERWLGDDIPVNAPDNWDGSPIPGQPTEFVPLGEASLSGVARDELTNDGGALAMRQLARAALAKAGLQRSLPSSG